MGDDVVGYVDLHGDERSTRELGFVIGRGLGTMAASAGLEYGFDVLKLSSVWAEAVDANVGSLRVLERIGMTRTGAGDDDMFLGVTSTYSRFALSRSDWEQR
ncbi:GNAT family N-acetyltransferase [Gulosibacter sediminis]|uniref:GNAT family N-acetyltransferase n=1 Tax=Gulosibacter sediminis TaxID=1729695 RepID=UPI0018681BA8|nr:GNAT family protein [Gulosibacter sediminis]